MSVFAVNSSLIFHHPLNPKKRLDPAYLRFLTTFLRVSIVFDEFKATCDRANAPNYFRSDIQIPLLDMPAAAGIRFLKGKLHWPEELAEGHEITNEVYQQRLDVLRRSIVMDYVSQQEAEAEVLMTKAKEIKDRCLIK